MLKHIYLFAWVLLAVDILNSVYKSTINPISVLIYSFITFVLLYVLGIWLAFFARKFQS